MAMERPIISITDFEGSKENILPVKSGRSAEQLSRMFGVKTTDSERQALNSKEVTHFETKLQQLQIQSTSYDQLCTSITSKEGTVEITKEEYEDPLSVWLEYYKWAKDAYPNTSKEYLRVIERCTSLFKDTKEYHNDFRFIKLWMRYVRYFLFFSSSSSF